MNVETCPGGRETDMTDCLVRESNRWLIVDVRLSFHRSVCLVFSLCIVLFDWILLKENTMKRKDKYSTSIRKMSVCCSLLFEARRRIPPLPLSRSLCHFYSFKNLKNRISFSSLSPTMTRLTFSIDGVRCEFCFSLFRWVCLTSVMSYWWSFYKQRPSPMNHSYELRHPVLRSRFYLDHASVGVRVFNCIFRSLVGFPFRR